MKYSSLKCLCPKIRSFKMNSRLNNTNNSYILTRCLNFVALGVISILSHDALKTATAQNITLFLKHKKRQYKKMSKRFIIGLFNQSAVLVSNHHRLPQHRNSNNIMNKICDKHRRNGKLFSWFWPLISGCLSQY